MRTPQDKSHLSKPQKNLKERLKNDLSYGKLSNKIGVSKGMLWRFINKGHLPEDKQKQAALGITLINVDIVPCTNCGGVHTRKCSPRKKRGERMLAGSRKEIAVLIAYIKFFKRNVAC